MSPDNISSLSLYEKLQDGNKDEVPDFEHDQDQEELLPHDHHPTEMFFICGGTGDFAAAVSDMVQMRTTLRVSVGVGDFRFSRCIQLRTSLCLFQYHNLGVDLINEL